jgi:hypothetical protein
MNSRGAARPEVGAIAWNWRFPKILACGLSNGTCVLWDLSKDKPRPVVSLRHPAGCAFFISFPFSNVQMWDLSKDKPRPVVSLRHPGGCASHAL